MVPEYPLQKVNITKPERKRSSNKKSSWASNTIQCHAISGCSKKRSREFVDRDPPSDESKCDYLDPSDLNLSQFRNIYTARNSYQTEKQLNQTDWPVKNSTVATYA
ncbi:unnamed protein product [Onchocerca ochengi]|nr:unnamed protein product [Onchocerca ochengi]